MRPAPSIAPAHEMLATDATLETTTLSTYHLFRSFAGPAVCSSTPKISPRSRSNSTLKISTQPSRNSPPSFLLLALLLPFFLWLLAPCASPASSSAVRDCTWLRLPSLSSWLYPGRPESCATGAPNRSATALRASGERNRKRATMPACETPWGAEVFECTCMW